MDKPTQKQQALIRKWKVSVPQTRAACSTVIDFVLGPGKEGIRERIRELRSVQRRWTNSWVRISTPKHPCKGEFGEVIGLRVRSDHQMRNVCIQHPRPRHFYQAIVRLEDGRKVYVGVTGLKLKIRSEQGQLFKLA